MSAVRLDRCESVDAFEAAAGDFLAAREAEHNLILGILGTLRTAAHLQDGPPLLAVVRRGPTVVAAAVRTPRTLPFNLVLSEVDDDGAIPALVELAVAADPPGIHGPVEAAGAVAAGWSALTGRGHRIERADRIFRLRGVIPPRPAPGGVRPAEPGERQLLLEWATAFMAEVHPGGYPATVEPIVDRWLADGPPTAYLWHDGEPVSLCVAGGPTPHGIRIGPVYTPLERRGRGYASACVAAVSQAQLDAGRTYCFLFTDLANPTANRIYQAIGYEPVRDVSNIRFDTA